MPETIKNYNSMAEFYALIGDALNQEIDFTIHRLEEIYSQAPQYLRFFVQTITQ